LGLDVTESKSSSGREGGRIGIGCEWRVGRPAFKLYAYIFKLILDSGKIGVSFTALGLIIKINS
jgi:hypothetical protein